MTLSVEDFASALPPAGRLIGLDLGSKTIGVALSDARRRIASPTLLIRRAKFTKDADDILRLADREEAAGIVIGLPVNMDGSEGKSAQRAREFARNLGGLTDLPMLMWDERLSTRAVTRTLIEADRSRKRRGEVVDKMAAAYILQGALDRLASL